MQFNGSAALRAWQRVARLSTSKANAKAVARTRTSSPLYEQPAVLRVPGQDLLTWRKDAQRRIRAISPSFQDPDTGPTAPELLRELDWLLDDACLDPQWKLSLGASAGKISLRCSLQQLEQLWHRRVADREPLQYVVGCSHWMHYRIAVGPGVLIPRPETAVLIEASAKAMGEDSWLKEGAWADLGTGSGALAIGLADCLSLPSKVYAVDLSDQACAWASLNVQRHDMQPRIEVVQSSWDSALEQHNGQLHGVLSNPPYIPQAVMAGLQAEVLQHEPHLALLGHGETGLEQLQSVCQAATRLLAPGGFLGVETGGPEQTKRLEDLLRAGQAFADVKQLDDMFGVTRFVLARRQY